MDPSGKTARAQNKLFAVQCSQLMKDLMTAKGRWTPQFHTVAKVVHGIQLYILSSFIYVVISYMLSFGVKQLHRSVMHLFLLKISVNFFMIVVLCC